MTCALEFDFLNSGFRDWLIALAPLPFVLTSAVIFVRTPSLGVKAITFLFTLGALFALYVFVRATYGRYLELRGHQNAGFYTNIEGPVVNFYESTSNQRRVEFVTVHNREFKISGPRLGSFGYSKRSTDGGLMLPGHYVKIRHINGEIVHLEICR